LHISYGTAIATRRLTRYPDLIPTGRTSPGTDLIADPQVPVVVQVIQTFEPKVLTTAAATLFTNASGPTKQVLARGRVRFTNTTGSPVQVTAFALPSGTRGHMVEAIPAHWMTSKMSTDRKAMLERRAKAVRIMRDVDAPHHLKVLAKRVRDMTDVALGLQDAMARRAERAKAAAQA
jgi:hypothetical protein